MGNNIASLTGSVAATPARASACVFSARGIFLMIHSFNRLKVSQTLVRYCAIRSSLDSYSPWTCSTTSWESLRIFHCATERASAIFILDNIASYSASLFDAKNPSRTAYSICSPVGDCRKSPTPEPNARDAPSTWRIHHPSLSDSASWEDWGIFAMKSTIT